MKFARVCEELKRVLLDMAVYERIEAAVRADPEGIVEDSFHLLQKIQNQGLRTGPVCCESRG
eukprot:NODE_11593_length_405_cov_1.573034_g10456_i0.p4 GENE.NODE_11593_length_405_cov_1.573034_g10456_i0~~NODE_11593_length_405_cov_1.573034_g10456_i0.p4  ORF type:complete len:62 (+),score=10.85 NODE_11593_length_405_cov_1.573034_g10456_i0:175-360(+)